MAATSHPLATFAALETLRAGGTAADAAVAAVATLCVVEPAMTGLGGDCFCLVAPAGKPVWGYNGSGRAGAGVTVEALRAKGVTSIGMESIHAVTTPGAVEAWDAILKAHGRFDLARVLQPAIRYAENGFPVAPKVAYDWAQQVGKLSKDKGAARHYLVNGRAPAEGETMRFPALAETLKTIARLGPRAFYEGPIAEDIARTVQSLGGLLAAGDLAGHHGETATPISTSYRGREVVELPPNGQGLAALVLLNIMENFDFATLDPLGADRLHLAVEAARLAYGVRDTHVADPAHMRVAVAALLDKGFAKKLAARLDPARKVPLPNAFAPGSDTVYLTVVDRDRTAVSLINSLYAAFGVGVATESTGIMLQNRGACFVVEPDHPNCVGPGKRPMHTIIPALGLRDGRCDLSFGVMGGGYQAAGHAYFVSNLTDYGMDVQAAIDLPRLFFEGDQTVVENGIPAGARTGLTARGHAVAARPLPLGGGQAIVIDWERGVLKGGSDPRKDGCALGY
ncbi:MAG: gamma-glutamyltransferase [Variibacter sp.]|nr:gamma-glutamyltransferase [Variibacter sp.]